MPHSTQLVSEEDRRTYRRWMRTLVLVYGLVIIVAIATTIMHVRQHQNIARAKATIGSSSLVDLAQVDR